MGDGFSFLDMLLILIFGSVDISYIVMEALTMAGFWKMFEKSGLRGYMALIPGVREYQLGRSAPYPIRV